MCCLIYQHLFQDYTHGFLLINLLFALSYFVCHNSCLFFSVLVVWTVHASFRVYFQVVKTVFFYDLIMFFYGLQTRWSLRLSLCYKHKLLWVFFLNHFLHHLYIFAWLLCCSTMRVSGFLHSFTVQLKNPLLVAVGRLCSTSLECSDKPVTRSHLCPAAPPDIAGRWPNLAWERKNSNNPWR